MATHYRRYQFRLNPRARMLRRDAPPAERKLWYEFLREQPEKFTRQKPLGRYIADFYCAGHRLVIEIDGDSHFDAKGERRDLDRDRALTSQGLRVLRFTNLDVVERFEGVCLAIRAALDE